MSSREFAEKSGRQHGNVMAMLRGAVSRGELDARETTYINSRGTSYPEFRLTLEQFKQVQHRLHSGELELVLKALGGRPSKVVKGVAKAAPLQVSVAAESVGRSIVARGFDLPYGAAPVSLVVDAPSPVLAAGQPLTMSSLEIAELTGKQHHHVVRDIRKMLEELRDDPNLDDVVCSTDKRGYTTEIRLPRDLTHTLVTGYSVPLRLAVIRRLEQLEAEAAKPAFQVPTTFLGAMKLATELEEQRLQLTHAVEVQAVKIEQDKPKVDFYDEVADTGELKGVAEVAKGLGTGEKRLFEYMRRHRILIGGSGDNRNQPFQAHIDAGRLTVKWNNYRVPETGEVKVHPRPLFTGKGITWIHNFVAKHGREGLE